MDDPSVGQSDVFAPRGAAWQRLAALSSSGCADGARMSNQLAVLSFFSSFGLLEFVTTTWTSSRCGMLQQPTHLQQLDKVKRNETTPRCFPPGGSSSSLFPLDPGSSPALFLSSNQAGRCDHTANAVEQITRLPRGRIKMKQLQKTTGGNSDLTSQ